MEKIFKKSLALVLSAALCLTALLGCLTVSAEGTAAKPTYALNAVEGKPGDTVTVTADITNVSEVCAHLIDIVFPTDLTLGKVTDSLGNTYLSYEAWVAAGSNSETPYYNPVAKTDGNHVCLVEFINWPSGDDAISTTSMKFFFECTIPTGATAGTVYTLTPTVQAGKYDDDTKLMDVALTPGKITVKAASTDAVLDDTITISTAINISETINTRIVVSKEIAKYADYELIVSRKKAYLIDSSSGYGLTEVQNFVYGKDKAYTTTSDGRGVFLYNELGMYELGIDMSIMVKCYDKDGNYVAYSNSATTNVGKLAYGLYSATNASAKNKNIAIDIAKLGDKAQAYMVNGKDCELATIVSPITYFPEDATEGAVFNVDNLDKTNIPESNVEGATVTPNVNLSSNPAICFLAAGVGTYDVNDLRLVIDYTNAKNGSDCGVEIAGTNLLTAGSGTNTRYYTLFNKIALYDSNVPVKATIYSGTTKLASLEYSIEAYVNANWSNARMGEVLKAVANLGTSARAYFNM